MDNIKNFIHNLNRDAYNLNKNIIGETSTMKKVALDESIYNNELSQPEQQPEYNKPVVPDYESNSETVIETSAIDSKTTKEFIDRLTSVEKKIDRFFNLIEKRVVKNAKEINIKIKLDESNSTKQE
tara:strand:+ start:4091 stop:4468 length:378 start_codon:yes stop_codon:yes gene_type:complete